MDTLDVVSGEPDRKRDYKSPESARRYGKSYYQKHRERILENKRRVTGEKLQRLRENSRRSYQKHKEKRKAEIRDLYNHRKQYRGVAEKMIGRPLAKGEHVHHIDCDHLNNVPENLAVVSSSEHQKAHLSINPLIKHLLASGAIAYNRTTNRYEIPGGLTVA